MKIRKTAVDDLEAINLLMHDSSAYKGQYSSTLQGYDVTESCLGKYPVFVATIDRDIVGFYSLIPNPAELDLLFVADSEQGKGIGKALFEHIRKVLTDMNIQDLKIVSHPPAV